MQEAGYFKPHRKTYEKAVELIGLEVMECMHVANHTFDCIGAKAAGMRSAFIDRRDRPLGKLNTSLLSFQYVGTGRSNSLV